ncbi:MAG: leucine-rich repeat domain-containing protein [Clostridiales bacterium]|nr:leucine-rich repeat domain-containing protein [Clostridiales bacterium]
MTLIEKYDPAWSIVSQIGEGGFSKVYKIVKEEFGFKYYSALKVIPVPQNSSELHQLREEGLDGDSLHTYINAMIGDLISEINLVREFKGMTNIVDYEDHKIIPKDGEPGYIILIRMELLESLAQIFVPKKLCEDDAVRVGIDICRALERLETRKIIHRDVKPENIFLSEYGDYKLGDFGIARQIEKTMSGMSRKGTYNYMAPEVFKGQEYGASVDLYSLGIVLYRILNSGRVPFLPPQTTVLRPSDKEAAFNKRMSGVPLSPPDGASSELSRIILKACAYEHRDRYASASEMRVALKEYAQAKISKEVKLKPPSPKPVTPVVEPKPVTPVIEPKPLNPPSTWSGFDSSDESTVKPPAPKPVIELTPPVKPKPVAEVPPLADRTLSIYDRKDKPIDEIRSATDRSKPHYSKLGMIIGFGVAIAFVVFLVVFFQTHKDPSTIVINSNVYSKSNTYIYISGAQLFNDDLVALKSITQLRTLFLVNCMLIDIKPLSELKNLEELNLYGNQITDISPLSELKNLEKLYLYQNQITDISPLFELKNLGTLSLSSNHITDIYPLSKLKNLKLLYLDYNQISDVSPLSELKNLVALSLSDNQITDISSLAKLTNLTTLHLYNNPILKDQIYNLRNALPNCDIFF